jgi:hypothetical protein
MRHIKLYEDYQDTVGAGMRDLFGLISEFTFLGKGDMKIKASGPSENEDAAKKIVTRTAASASWITDELEAIGWSAEVTLPVSSYVVKGPFVDWTRARRIIRDVEEYAKTRCYKSDKSGYMTDDEYDEIFYEATQEIMTDPETEERFGNIGYRIEEVE